MVPERKKTMQELAGSGDDGTTGLLGGGRASKDDLRIETYGTVDEASSALGLAKALTSDPRVRNPTCRKLESGFETRRQAYDPAGLTKYTGLRGSSCRLDSSTWS